MARPNGTDVYFQDLPEDKRARVIEDLQGVGVTPKYFKLVHVANDVDQVKRWVATRFRFKENVLIFGSAGIGKTEIINASAKQEGYDSIIEPTSSRLAEDYGGIPMANRQQMPDDVFRALVKNKLLEEKVDAEIAKEIEARKKTSQINEKVIRLALRGKIAPTVQVTDAEIDKAIADGRFPNSRIEQEFSAPGWVLRIMDKYRKTGKKTVIFFDEINQAQPNVLNTLFGLIQNKRFADREEYSIEDAAIFAAAGNFYRENPAISKLPDPLISRFDFIIYYDADWEGSIMYLKDSYLGVADQCPALADILSDSSITAETWAAAFPTPRNAEKFIKLLMRLELDKTAGKPVPEIVDLDQVGLKNNDKSTLALAVKRFLKKLGFEAFGVNKQAAQASDLMKKRMQMKQIQRLIKEYNRSIGNYSFNDSVYTKDPAGATALWKAIRNSTTAVTDEDIQNLSLEDGTDLVELLKSFGINESDI